MFSDEKPAAPATNTHSISTTTRTRCFRAAATTAFTSVPCHGSVQEQRSGGNHFLTRVQTVQHLHRAVGYAPDRDVAQGYRRGRFIREPDVHLVSLVDERPFRHRR